MKRIFSFVLLICTIIIISCATLENVVVLNSPNGTNFFLRNTVVKTKNSKIIDFEFDITVNVEKNEITGNPVVNYTYTLSKNNYSEGEKSKLYFENEGIRYSVINPDFMFKDLDQKKNMHMRYTSELNKDEFEKIMSNYSQVSVVIILSDGSEIVLRDKKIDEKINDMRLLVK